MPASQSQTTPRLPPQQQQQQQQQQQSVAPVLAIPPLPRKRRASRRQHRGVWCYTNRHQPRAGTADEPTLRPPLCQGRATRQSERRSNQECGECPPNSTFPSQVRYPQISKLGKAGPGPSKNIAKPGVSSSLLDDPRASRFARRFDSLTGHRRTISIITIPPDLPGEQTSNGARRDNTAKECSAIAKPSILAVVDAARADLDSQRRRVCHPACICAT